MPLIPTQEPPYYEISNSPGGGGTKEYVALLTQTGTSAPTATVLKNTFTVNDFTLNYTGEGDYYIESLSNQFTMNKTAVFITQSKGGSVLYHTRAWGNDGADFISILTAAADGTGLNEVLDGTQAIQILVYP